MPSLLQGILLANPIQTSRVAIEFVHLVCLSFAIDGYGTWMYDSSMKSKTFPLAMPKELLTEVRQAARKTGLSMADTMRQSMKLGLDKLVRELGRQTRITNVDPLPDAVLERVYSRPERDEKGIRRACRT